MTNLITKLEHAEEGSRELDALVAIALGWTGHKELVVGAMGGNYYSNWYKDAKGETRFELPEWTTCVSTALALVERELPGWVVANLGQSDDRSWWCELRNGYRTSFKKAVMSDLRMPSPALAICAALLKAKEAQ